MQEQEAKRVNKVNVFKEFTRIIINTASFWF